MKKQALILGTLLGIQFLGHGQDIGQNEVPSIILNQFNRQFPKATDIEWKLDGHQYQVEFEIGWNLDHEIWYDPEGNIVKHKEDVAAEELSKAVVQKIDSEFKGYTLDDMERITENGKVVYRVELNSLMHQDWEVILDENGNVLSKKVD